MTTFILTWDFYSAICFSHFTLYVWLLTEVIPVGTMPLEVSVIYDVNSLKVIDCNL